MWKQGAGRPLQQSRQERVLIQTRVGVAAGLPAGWDDKHFWYLLCETRSLALAKEGACLLTTGPLPSGGFCRSGKQTSK